MSEDTQVNRENSEVCQVVEDCVAIRVFNSEISPSSDLSAAGNDNGQDVSSADEKVCRMCHIGGQSGELIELGCLCKNDLGLVHEECAKKWFRIKNNRTCEICRNEAKNVRIKFLWCSFQKVQMISTLVWYPLMFLILVFVLFKYSGRRSVKP